VLDAQAEAALGPQWLQTTLAWQEADPVNDFERHRNAAIHGKPGNRKAKFDHPDLAERIRWGPPHQGTSGTAR
jgi:endonuclease I